jgi:hypothetical protein
MSRDCACCGQRTRARFLRAGRRRSEDRDQVDRVVLHSVRLAVPPFYAIAWMYREDYARDGIRMLPVIEPDGESILTELGPRGPRAA